MATRDEIVDQIAGFALFADLTTPQLERIAHMFEEEVFPEGARVLRQGLSGSAFYIILDGEAAVVIDGQQRATLARGDFFGEVSILLGEPPGADIVASRPLRTLVLAGPAVHGRPPRQPAADVPDAPGAGAPSAEREPVAELTAGADRAADRRPFPPGDYPVVVVGSGPGAIQVSYSLRRHGRRPRGRLGRPGARAGCSGAGRSSSGCCRGPSRTRRSSTTRRAYERYDWN